MRAIAKVGAAILAAGALQTAAAAQSQIYRMVWDIPSQSALTQTSDLVGGTEFARLKLTPPGLFQATSDVVEPDGALLVSAGTQLVRLQSAMQIACTFGPTKKNGGESVLFAGSLKRVCLLDADNDGKFEARFLRATNGPAFFLLRGRFSDRVQPILPTRLALIDPNLIENGPRLAIRLAKRSNPDTSVFLEADVGGERSPLPLEITIRADVSQLPATFDLYGGTIQVTKALNNKFAVRVLRPFHSQALDFWD